MPGNRHEGRTKIEMDICWNRPGSLPEMFACQMWGEVGRGLPHGWAARRSKEKSKEKIWQIACEIRDNTAVQAGNRRSQI